MRTADSISETSDRAVFLLDKLTTKLDKYIRIITTITGIIVVTLVSVNVFMRYLGGGGLGWTNELSLYLTIWITMLLVGPLLKQDEHLSVEVVVQKFSLETRQKIRLIELGLIIVLGVVVLYYGWRQFIGPGFYRHAPATKVPMAVYYASLPTGGFLMILFGIDKLIQVYQSPEALDEDYARKYGNRKSSTTGES